MRLNKLSQTQTIAHQPTHSLVRLLLVELPNISFKTGAMALVLAGLTACQSTSPAVSGGVPDAQLQVGAQSGTQASRYSNLDKKNIAQVRTTLAAQYIRKNELDAAQRQLEKAFAADSRYAPAYDMMGVLLQQEGSRINLQKADGYFKKAIELDPDFIQARNNYGVYLSQMQRYNDAVQQFEIAGASLGYEGRIGALENLGRTQLKLGNKPEAIKAFLRALDGNRNSLISHIELVDLLIDANQPAKAQALYEETLLLIRGQPLSPRLLMQGIKLAAAQGNLNERQVLSEQLLSSYPLSDEAKQLKIWLNNPEATWK